MNGALARRVVDCLQYRRACGNLRLWSGLDNQESNARVSRSQRFTFGCACLVRCEQPRNPLPLGMGRVNIRFSLPTVRSPSQPAPQRSRAQQLPRVRHRRRLEPAIRPKARRRAQQESLR